MTAKNNSKIRFGLLDAVVLIVVIALALALIFRYTADKRLFVYDTEEYTVRPLSLSSPNLSITNLNLFSPSSNCCSAIAPAFNNKCPTKVDFPWSTCPINAKLICSFSFAIIITSL